MNNQTDNLIRFITAGSVDDGKSTLIGRLLFDSKSILADQLSALSSEKNKKFTNHEIDFSFLTDGLESEREQGITIDVAYRYFSTREKKFIIADCPGHEQYTRNMVTGASTADAVILLVDASQAVDGKLLTQTRRHVAISCLLNIPNVILAVNKMDLVEYNEKIYQSIVQSFENLLKIFHKGKNFFSIPISALHGDNIIKPSENMSWYKNSTLIATLEANTLKRKFSGNLRLPIQLVMRWDNQEKNDERAYCGKIESGELKKNQLIKTWPSNQNAKITKIIYRENEVSIASKNQCVTICLDKDIDVSRGDYIVSENNYPDLTKQINVEIAWLDSDELNIARKYILKQSTREIIVKVKLIDKLNLNTLQRESADSLLMNEIGKAVIKSAQPILGDSFIKSPKTGCFILIDIATNQTCAAGMVC